MGVEYRCDMDYDKYRDERGRYVPCRLSSRPCEVPSYVAEVSGEYRIYVDEAFSLALSPDEVVKELVVRALACSKSRNFNNSA